MSGSTGTRSRPEDEGNTTGERAGLWQSRRTLLLGTAAGGALAVLVTFAVESLSGARLGVEPPVPPCVSAPLPPRDGSPGVSETNVASPVRRRFADLYLAYLLDEYYTPTRGYCRPLLKRACSALLNAKLLDYPAQCDTVPNSAFVLAVGRFQAGTGLPVDGKAGPATVGKLVGGSYESREAMAADLCRP